MAYGHSFVSQTKPPVLNPGDEYEMTIVLKNTGDVTWNKTGGTPVRLGTSVSRDRISGFYPGSPGDGWLSGNRIEMVESSVAPNANGTFTFKLKHPGGFDLAGEYPEYFEPVVDGVGWMGPTVLGINVRVTVPAPVGTTLFGWYKEDGFGYVASQTPGDAAAISPDMPVGGWYNSLDTDVINRQLTEMDEAGINFVAIDFWWDNNNGGSYGQMSRDHFAAVIDEMETNFPHMRICPLVEPQPGILVPHDVPTQCYDYFQTNYGSSPVFMTHQGKKLVFTFCRRRGAANTNFNTLSMCNDSTSGYSFNFWSVPAVPLNHYLTIMHRFDNRHLTGIASSIRYHNPSLSEGVWHDQCSVAKNNRGNLKLLLISPYNEGHERQNWEPHTNYDSDVPDDFMYKQVQDFITEWRS